MGIVVAILLRPLATSVTPASGGEGRAANQVASTVSAFGVQSVENAREAAVATIKSDCHTAASITDVRTDEKSQGIDDKIDAAKATPESWVVEGELWLGSHDRAAQAFGASETYRDTASTWIVVDESTGPVAYELVDERSASGDVVWSLRDREMACPSGGPVDSEADPVYPEE
ncbi:MAG: hypothetical protein WKF78_13600 [Candidatus Limnocylindrales bacterium]